MPPGGLISPGMNKLALRDEEREEQLTRDEPKQMRVQNRGDNEPEKNEGRDRLPRKIALTSIVGKRLRRPASFLDQFANVFEEPSHIRWTL